MAKIMCKIVDKVEQKWPKNLNVRQGMQQNYIFQILRPCNREKVQKR